MLNFFDETVIKRGLPHVLQNLDKFLDALRVPGRDEVMHTDDKLALLLLHVGGCGFTDRLLDPSHYVLDLIRTDEDAGENAALSAQDKDQLAASALAIMPAWQGQKYARAVDVFKYLAVSPEWARTYEPISDIVRRAHIRFGHMLSLRSVGDDVRTMTHDACLHCVGLDDEDE